MKKVFFILPVMLLMLVGCTQNFSGTVKDTEGNALSEVKVLVKETGETVMTNDAGEWTIPAGDEKSVTLVFGKDGYMHEHILKQAPAAGITMSLRKAIKSVAALRQERYEAVGCDSVIYPEDESWNVDFVHSELKGDLAPDPVYTRRDPSAVIKVDSLFYMWYSYSLTEDKAKNAPWDLNDLYYATSTDGITWNEVGAAIERGPEGSYDHRSVFTTEIFVADGKYYLVYQAAADTNGIYDRNTVGIASADSPDGPWIKLEEPVLHPTYTDDIFFDNNAVHDPCVVTYNGKYYLYYKGECNCLENENCKKWCDPVCGTWYDHGGGFSKQVKWGVAISDNPTGPFVKSDHNPITNTGHEVMVWPYKDGMCILQHQDGAEANTIQYANDGVNFEIMGKVTGIPEAAGLYRTAKSDDNPHTGVEWGVAHVLKWDAGPNGWMYITRFDKKTE